MQVVVLVEAEVGRAEVGRAALAGWLAGWMSHVPFDDDLSRSLEVTRRSGDALGE